MPTDEQKQERERQADRLAREQGRLVISALETEFKRKPTPRRFVNLMNDLRKWREDDHADNINLHRSQIIALIEGVDALTSRGFAAGGVAEKPTALFGEIPPLTGRKEMDATSIS